MEDSSNRGTLMAGLFLMKNLMKMDDLATFTAMALAIYWFFLSVSINQYPWKYFDILSIMAIWTTMATLAESNMASCKIPEPNESSGSWENHL